MKNTKDKTKQVRQVLIKALVERTGRDLAQYQKPQSISPDVPGKLALCLDDLLDLAEKESGQQRAGALADVIELGIAAWYWRLDPESFARLDLPSLDLDSDPNAAEAQARVPLFEPGGYLPLTSHTLPSNPNPAREARPATSPDSRRRGGRSRKRRRR